MNWDAYTTLMAANGQQVFADKVGHHGVYSGVTKTSPTVYPHRLDTHEMRLRWVMEREVRPYLSGLTPTSRRVFWKRGSLFMSLLADIIRALVADGYRVSEEECPTYGWSLIVTLPTDRA